MKNKKLLVVLGVLLGLSQFATAQKYRTALGVRIGKSDFGITVQQKVFEKTTLEGIGGVSPREARGTLLLERHFPLIGKSFNYYLGGGAHVGTLKEYGPFYGADAIAGVEMKLPLFPLVASVDIKPSLHANHENWVSLQGGFSVRYILVKEKRQERKILGIFGKKEEEKKRSWPFGKKEEPPKKKPGIFGKKPEPEPVKKRTPLFGKPVEPEPEPPKRNRLFEREPAQPEPEPQPQKRGIRW
jgi:hypothetical protein